MYLPRLGIGPSETRDHSTAIAVRKLTQQNARDPKTYLRDSWDAFVWQLNHLWSVIICDLYNEHISNLLAQFNCLTVSHDCNSSLDSRVIVDIWIIMNDDVEFGWRITVMNQIIRTSCQQVVVESVKCVVVNLGSHVTCLVHCKIKGIF